MSIERVKDKIYTSLFYNIISYNKGRLLNDNSDQNPIGNAAFYEGGSGSADRLFTLQNSNYDEYYNIISYNKGRLLNDNSGQNPIGSAAFYEGGSGSADRLFNFVLDGDYAISSDLISFQYTQPDYNKLPHQKTFMETRTISNCAGNTVIEQNVELSKTISASNSLSFSHTTTMGIGVSTTISASVPFLESASVTTSFDWSQSSTEDTSKTVSNSQTFTAANRVTVQPHQCTTVVGWFNMVEKGDYKIPFTAKIKASVIGPVYDNGQVNDKYQLDNTDAIVSLFRDKGNEAVVLAEYSSTEALFEVHGEMSAGFGFNSYIETQDCSCELIAHLSNESIAI